MPPSGSPTMIAPDIAEITGCLSPAARAHLISFLGELFNVLDNLSLVCENDHRPCAEYLQLPRLRALLTALNMPSCAECHGPLVRPEIKGA